MKQLTIGGIVEMWLSAIDGRIVSATDSGILVEWYGGQQEFASLAELEECAEYNVRELERDGAFCVR